MGLQARNPNEEGELDDLLAEDPNDEPLRNDLEDPADEQGQVDLQRIHHIGIAVADLDDTLDDYRELFGAVVIDRGDRKSTRLNSSHVAISYAVFCLKKKKTDSDHDRSSNRK